MGDQLGIIHNGVVKRTREWDGSDGWNEDVRINAKAAKEESVAPL